MLPKLVKVHKWLLPRATHDTNLQQFLEDIAAEEYVVYLKPITEYFTYESNVTHIKLKANFRRYIHSFFRIFRPLGNGLYSISSYDSDGEAPSKHLEGILYVFDKDNCTYEIMFNFRTEETYLIAYSDTTGTPSKLFLSTLDKIDITESHRYLYLVPFSWV